MENENIPLIDELNTLTGGEYNFTLKSASLNRSADFCVIEIYYKDGTLISRELKAQLEAKVKSLVPDRFKYELVFIKNYVSTARITEDVLKLLKSSYSSIFFSLDSVVLEGKNFTICLSIDSLSFDYAKNKKLDEAICTNLKAKYEDYNFSCTLSSAKVFKEDEEKKLKESYRETEVDSTLLRKIDFTDLVMLVGDNIEGSAAYIKDKIQPEKSVTLCGKITSIKSHVMKRKPKDDGEKPEEEKAKQSEEPQTDEAKSESFISLNLLTSQAR